jgi:hypothetical protein
MIIPTTSTTKIIPVHTPALKIPSIAAQLLKIADKETRRVAIKK